MSFNDATQRAYRDATYRMAEEHDKKRKGHARQTAVQRSGKTAISRRTASAPTRWLKNQGLINGTVLDYGCGKGLDVDYLRNMGFDTSGWDPNHRPDNTPLNHLYDTVLCNYVLNTLPYEMEHVVLARIKKQLKRGVGVAYITVRRDIKKEGFTRRGTYQRMAYPDLEVVRKTASYEIYKMTSGVEGVSNAMCNK